MANEVELIEVGGLRGGPQILPMPPVNKQLLTIGGSVSTPFKSGVSVVRIQSSAACHIEFSPSSGTAPVGTGFTIPLAANMPYDFTVVSGMQVIAVT